MYDFPKVQEGQRCQYDKADGYVEAYVSEVFDEGFVIQRKDGLRTRFFTSEWDEAAAGKLVLLHEGGKPVMRTSPWAYVLIVLGIILAVLFSIPFEN